jgi:N12 class adenine-specific DNA methylase
VSLDTKGTIDIAFIAGLYGKPEESIVAVLGDLIYHDPESRCRQTAEQYLSGIVPERPNHVDGRRSTSAS